MQHEIFKNHISPTLERLKDELGQFWFERIGRFVYDQKELFKRLEEEYGTFRVFPDRSLIFRPYRETASPPKALILLQEPYFNINASGLALECKNNVLPQLSSVLGHLGKQHKPDSPYTLSHWSAQGIMLLNNPLTVRHKESGSHLDIGWEAVIRKTLSMLPSSCGVHIWGKKNWNLDKWVNPECVIYKDSLPTMSGFGTESLKRLNENFKL